MPNQSSRVLKRGLELLIPIPAAPSRETARRTVEEETVRVTGERVERALRYSENGERKRANEDFDLTHLVPSEKSAGRVWNHYRPSFSDLIKRGL